MRSGSPASPPPQTAGKAEPAQDSATFYSPTAPNETAWISVDPAVALKPAHGSALTLSSTLADIVAKLTTLHPAGRELAAAGCNAETGSPGDSHAQATAGSPAASEGFAFHLGRSAAINVGHDAAGAASIEPGTSATTDNVETIIGFNKAAGDKIKIEGAVSLTSVTPVAKEGRHQYSLIALSFDTGQAGGKPIIETIKIYGDPISKADIVLVKQDFASTAAAGLDHDERPDPAFLAVLEDHAGHRHVDPSPKAQAPAGVTVGDLPHLALG